uniref:Uncharacterized protein n=1 Tax=Nannochloropsis gaditana (strain CCMP526) TaxID=1093141 RepID=I2CR51_NANGC
MKREEEKEEEGGRGR